MSGEAVIETSGLGKAFGEVQALADVELSAMEGSVLGLLGPNGAGKTTCVRFLTTLLKPDSGTARVAGHDVVKDATALRADIGLAGQYAAVDENLTGEENLTMVGRLYHLGRAAAKERSSRLLERFELDEASGRLVKTYSGGMRRRLDLAAALVIRPAVVFLDEPTTGLDPRSRLALWETIEGLVSEGTTVLLTTQYLDEADRLADRIAVLDRGGVIAEGTSDELKAQVGGERLEVRLEDRGDCEKAVQTLAEIASERPEFEEDVIRAPISARQGKIAEAVRRLDAADVGIEDITIRRPTLDNVFLGLTGHAAEEADDGDGDGEDGR